MSQADWNLLIKSSNTSANAYQQMYAKKRKEEEDAKKNEIVFGDNTGTNGKAATVEQGKGFWDGVGDFAKGVGDTVAGSAKGAADFTSATVGGGFEDLVGEVTGQNDITRSYQQKTLEQNTDMVKLSGKKMKDASLSDEERERWKKIFNKYSSDDSAYKETEEYNQGQIDRGTKAIEGAADAYKTAQYIPGFSIGTEGFGTLAALKDGDDSTTNKALIKLTQDLDWDKLSDEEKKAALVQRNIGGALSTLDLLPVTGKAARVGVKTTLKEGAKAGLKAAGKEVAGSIGGKTIKEVAGVGVKELAKQAGKSAASGAITGAGLGVGLNAVMGGNNWRQALIEGAKGGFIGGFIGSPLDIDVKSALKASGQSSLDVPDDVLKAIIDDIDATKAKTAEEAALLAEDKATYQQMLDNRKAGLNDDGSKFINLDDTKKQIQDMQNGNYSEDLYDVTKSDGTPVDPEYIKAATQKQVDLLTEKRDIVSQQVDAINDPAAREMAMQNVNKLDDQIAAIKSGDTQALMETGSTGLSRKLNIDRVREQFSQLQNDYAMGNFKKQQAMDEAAKRTAPTRTLSDVSSEIDAIGAGGVAPEAVTPLPDFTSAKEVASTPNMPRSLKAGATILESHRVELDRQRSNIMTRSRADSELDKLDLDYNKQMSRIEMMPEPRRTAEMERVQAEYKKSYTSIEDMVAKDSAKARELDMVEEQITANTNALLADANLVKDKNPTEFGIVHEEMNQKIIEEVRKDTEKAIFNNMTNSEGLPDSENISRAMADIPSEKIDSNLDAPEVKALTDEALKDTFINESYKELSDNLIKKNINMTYLGATFKSNNIVLEKILGKKGLEIYSKILHGYNQTNIANRNISSRLTKIKEGLGGSAELNSKFVDLLQGKDTNLDGLTPQQLDAFKETKELVDLGSRMVQKAAYNEKKFAFSNRSLNKKLNYTVEEIGQLAKRDGITIKEAEVKYGTITEFKKSDVEYICSEYANHSTLDNYYPHIFDNKGKEKPSFGDSEYIKSDGDVNFGNMLHREKNKKGYSKDIVDVFSKYFAGLNKKTYLEPELRRLDDVKLVIKKADSDANPVWKWVDSYQAQLKYNKPDAVGKGFNELVDKALAVTNPNSDKIGNNHYRSLLSTQRQVNSLAALGFSFRNGIQQFTQIGNAIGELGPKNVLSGAMKYLQQRYTGGELKNQYIKLLEDNGITNAGIAHDAFSELAEDTIGGVLKSKGDKFSSVLMFMSQKMDEFARGTTYEASMLENLKKGLSQNEASILASGDAARLNFVTSKVDMPIALNGDTVRSMTQFMTFSYKQVEAWTRIGMKPIKDLKSGNYKLAAKDASRLVQMVAFYGLTFEAMSKLAGIEPEDNIPFYGNVKDGALPQSPLLSMLMGGENTPGLVEILTGTVNPGGDNEFDKEQNRQKSFEDLTNMMIKNFVPAGNQIQKSIKGFQSASGDGVVSKNGQVKFIQNTDDASKLKATLFGQYSTEAGREWINKQFPTLSVKQSEILQEQKTAESKKRAYDFYAGLKDATTKGTVTPKIKDTMTTQPAKAQRLIQEHNAQVKKAVDNYTAKYGELSKYEADYLAKNYFITYGTLTNITDNITEE